MKYCSACASPVELKTPEDDNRLRYVCSSCDTIHYQNPNIIAGTLPVYQDKVLLCKRAIEPRKGYWTLPAGFMENNESTEQGALRETWEEAMAKVELQQFYSMITVPAISQVHIFFLAKLSQPEFSAGPESLEVALFSEQDIPWQDIAFGTVKMTLKKFFADRQQLSTPYPSYIDTIIIDIEKYKNKIKADTN